MLRQPVVQALISASFFFFGGLATLGQQAGDATPSTETGVDFRRDIEPILHHKCYSCHGPSEQMNGLRLDNRTSALRGSYSGPVILPGSSARSTLIERVASSQGGFRMPLAGPPLSARELDLLRRWIDLGADWPEGGSKSHGNDEVTRTGKEHWAFQPIWRPEPPPLQNASWVRNPIDAFVLARLESEGIQPSPEADKHTLIRRLSLDLIGLPPTPEEIREFLSADHDSGYQRLVDRLLKSPHYGEKWGRHWLDVARYADSDGYEKDLPRPYAWRWRHWIIEALNRDTPFDEFTVWQIAGDLLPRTSVESMVATGFHRNTLRNREAGVRREQDRYEAVVDRTNTIGTVWLGLTLACAQCHDHKYDSITQKEYYEFFAFFNQAETVDIDAPLPGELGPYLQARPGYYRRRKALLLEYRVPDLQTAWAAKLIEAIDNPGKYVDWDDYLTAFYVELDHAEEKLRKGLTRRTQREKDEITDYFVRNPGPEISKRKDKKEKFKELRNKLEELAESFPDVSRAYALRKRPRKTHIAIRGDYQTKGLEVEPGTLALLPSLPASDEPPRLQLARWLVSRNNPLTARVVVNRMWQRFFGRGLVRTPEDFGTRGERPTHPRLLDWLAEEFMGRGWGLKSMHRLIVMSATYRQASHARPELSEKDPENGLLARQTRLRLPAELIRDVALQASGLLYPVIGGKSIRPVQPEWVSQLSLGNAKWEASEGKDRYRRGLYVHFQRTAPHPQLVNFDAPNANASAVRRSRSNTPLQALNLLNDPVFFEASQAFAVRVLREAPPSWEGRLDYAFLLCLGRPPTDREKREIERYFVRAKSVLARDPESVTSLAPNPVPGVEPVGVATWVGVARVLMNLDEFITRE